MGMGVINLLCVRGWKGGGICLRVCVNASPLFTPYPLPCASCDNFICYLLSHVDCFIMYSVFQYVYNCLNLLSRHKPALYPFFCE